ncbi:CBO0543 family protein [Priestia megaterium]
MGITIAFILNDLGSNYFWQFKPTFRDLSLSALPLNIGFYPVLSAFLIYFKVKKQINTIFLLLCFTLFTTGFEGMGLVLGKVEYFNGWNIIGTFISYLIAYFIIYGYYRSLVKHHILKD